MNAAQDPCIDATALYLRAGVSSKIEGHESAAGPLFDVVVQMLDASTIISALAAQDDALERACAVYANAGDAEKARTCLHQRVDLAQAAASSTPDEKGKYEVPLFIVECLQRQVERINAIIEESG